MVPKCGEEGLLSAQPDSRSSPAAGVNAEMGPAIWVLEEWSTCTRPSVQPAFPSNQTVNQVWVGLLYRITGSPKVLAKGLQPTAVE